MHAPVWEESQMEGLHEALKDTGFSDKSSSHKLEFRDEPDGRSMYITRVCVSSGNGSDQQKQCGQPLGLWRTARDNVCTKLFAGPHRKLRTHSSSESPASESASVSVLLSIHVCVIG